MIHATHGFASGGRAGRWRGVAGRGGGKGGRALRRSSARWAVSLASYTISSCAFNCASASRCRSRAVSLCRMQRTTCSVQSFSRCCCRAVALSTAAQRTHRVRRDVPLPRDGPHAALAHACHAPTLCGAVVYGSAVQGITHSRVLTNAHLGGGGVQVVPQLRRRDPLRGELARRGLQSLPRSVQPVGLRRDRAGPGLAGDTDARDGCHRLPV